MLSLSASRNANGTEKDHPRKRISERPVAPQPPSPYDNEMNNALSDNIAPRREPHSRLELLEEALQERARPQKSSIRREEVTKDSFEDVDDYSFGTPSPPADNEEWEQVPDDMSVLPHQGESYLFPGTWPAALSDTSEALKDINTATSSYFTALSHSGIGRATTSISTAALASTNNAALALTTWGLAKTGFGAHELPWPMQKWVQAKEERERKRRQKENRKRRQNVGDGVFEDDRGSFVLDTREKVIDEVEGDGDGWEVQELRDREAADESEGEDSGDALLKALNLDDEDDGEAMLREFNFQDED